MSSQDDDPKKLAFKQLIKESIEDWYIEKENKRKESVVKDKSFLDEIGETLFGKD